jgi:regulator of sigma E protease
MSVVFAILLFSLLIFVHELGHFAAAKASGVQVNEFCMFMGPAIFKKQVGETLYSIRCIPFGGYCAMEGEDSDTDNPRSFQKAKWWKRLIILVAGSFMNLLIGVVIMICVYLPVQELIVPVIDGFSDYATVDGADGLQVGDKILKVDGENIYVQSDFSTILGLNGGDVHDLVVERNGEKVYLNDFKMEKHETTLSTGEKVMLYGMNFTLLKEPTFMDKVAYGWNSAIDAARLVRLSLQMIFSGQAGLQDMTGPVGIIQQMSDMADSAPTWVDSLLNMLYFGGFIAINLAIMNMLPLPALDGGRTLCLLLTTAVEAVIRKKIDPKYEGYLHAAGMILLLGLMAIILFKDIFTIIKG